MFKTLPKTTNCANFLEEKPDGILYELQDKVIVEMQPIGEHEEINDFLSGEVSCCASNLTVNFSTIIVGRASCVEGAGESVYALNLDAPQLTRSQALPGNAYPEALPP
jgi:Uma2 family endonuclease